MVVTSDGRQILIVDVVNDYDDKSWGNFERSMREAKDMRVFLTVGSLSSPRPPTIPDASELTRKAQALWHSIKRALRKENEALEDEVAHVEQANAGSEKGGGTT
jgi:hypothetical protein